MTVAERFLRIGIRVYPRAFRERYEEELIEFIAHERILPQNKGLGRAIRFWIRTIADVMRVALRMRRTRHRRQQRDLQCRAGYRTAALAVRRARIIGHGMGAQRRARPTHKRRGAGELHHMVRESSQFHLTCSNCRDVGDTHGKWGTGTDWRRVQFGEFLPHDRHDGILGTCV